MACVLKNLKRNYQILIFNIDIVLINVICCCSAVKKYVGHSAGGVGCVDFTLGDKYVLSVGIDDRLLLQWKVRTNMHWILRKEMHA